MDIDIETYRQRIGSFGPGRGFRSHKYKAEYSPYSAWGSDIHERALLICLLLCSTLLTSHTLAVSLMSTATIADQIVFPSYGCHPLLKADCHINACQYMRGETGWQQSTYSTYSSRVLSLSMDIETNPGPVTDKEEILNAIYNTSKDLKSEIQFIKSDMIVIKSEMEMMINTCAELKSMTSNLQEKQSKVEKRLDKVESNIKYANENQEVIQLDIDAIQYNVDENSDRVNIIEDRFEKMELQSIKCNMRIFGLDEISNEHDEFVLKQNVIDNVLNIASPTSNWSEYSITNAFRIGNSNQGQPKITIIKFANFTDKVNIFKGRDTLRDSGIRISDDLTVKQRSKLSELKIKGEVGYYQKGELKVRPKKDDNANNKPRVFVNATRRLQNIDEDDMGIQNYNDSQTMSNESQSFSV